MPLMGIAFLLASCNSGENESYEKSTFLEYNLLVDTQDANAPAQVAYARYEATNYTYKGTVDLKGDLILDNRQYSFETDTMMIRAKYFSVNGQSAYYSTFSKKGPSKAGSIASDIDGTIVVYYKPMDYLLYPDYNLNTQFRLDLSYILNDRYAVQTFSPYALYRGETTSMAGGQANTINTSDYVVDIDFGKDKASVYVYNAKFSSNPENPTPKIIRFEDIPVAFSHDGFTLESAAPKTTVIGKKDNQAAMVDSVGYAASDFSFRFISKDLTKAAISYKLDGYDVNFQGSSSISSDF